MRSVPLTMTRDMLYRCQLPLVGCTVGGVGFTCMILSLLQHGGLDANNPSMRLLLFRLISFNLFFCGCSTWDSTKLRTGLYTLPITTGELVAIQMVPAMLSTGLAVVATNSMENVIFQLQYPIWGPALFAAASFAACWATYWYTKESVWQPIALFVVAGLLAGWYLMRFYPFVEGGVDRIGELPVIDLVLLVILACVSYFVAVEGVARHRRGDHFTGGRSLSWMWGTFDFSGPSPAKFQNAAEAQFWFEWRKKCWMMPGAISVMIVIGLSIWLVGNRDPQVLVAGFVSESVWISIFLGGMGGFVFGTYGCGWIGTAGNHELTLGSFVSSRPIADPHLGNTILRLIWKNVFTAWAIWAVTFAVVAGVLLVMRCAPDPLLPPSVRWWYFPATLLGLWGGTATASLVLAGDERRPLQLIVFVEGGGFLLFLFAEWCLSAEAKSRLFQVATMLVGLGFVIWSVWVFDIARRQRLVSAPKIAACLGTWGALTALIVTEKLCHPMDPLASTIFAIGFAALVVAPFAGVPLAVAKNRHR